jgi:hypothetical protein
MNGKLMIFYFATYLWIRLVVRKPQAYSPKLPSKSRERYEMGSLSEEKVVMCPGSVSGVTGILG